MSDDEVKIDHKNVSKNHVLDYPITSARSAVKVRTETGSHKLRVTQPGGGLQLTTLETQGSIKLEALVRGADGEIRTGFRIPVEAIPDLIRELREGVENVESHADERGYDGVRCNKAKGDEA